MNEVMLLQKKKNIRMYISIRNAITELQRKRSVSENNREALAEYELKLDQAKHEHEEKLKDREETIELLKN